MNKSLTYGNNPLSCPINFFLNPVDSVLHPKLFPLFSPHFQKIPFLFSIKRIYWGKTFFIPLFPSCCSVGPNGFSTPPLQPLNYVFIFKFMAVLPFPPVKKGCGWSPALGSLLSAGLPTKQPFTIAHPQISLFIKVCGGLIPLNHFYPSEPFTFPP